MKPIQWLFGLLGLTLAILPWQAFAQSFVSDNELRTDILEVDKKIKIVQRRIASLQGQHNRLQTELIQLRTLLQDVRQSIDDSSAAIDALATSTAASDERLEKELTAIMQTHNRQLGNVRQVVEGADILAYEKALLRYSKQDDIAGVLEDLRSITELEKLSHQVPAALFWIGRIQYEQNQFDKSRAALERLLKQYPGSARESEALWMLAELESLQGNDSTAEKWKNRLRQQYPTSLSLKLLERYDRQL